MPNRQGRTRSWLRDGDWDKVARVGGPEVHKVAMRGVSKGRGGNA